MPVPDGVARVSWAVTSLRVRADGGWRPLAAAETLDAGDCIHAELALRVDDVTRSESEACIRDWILLVRDAESALADDAPEAQLSGLAHRRGDRAYVRLGAGGSRVACDRHALMGALDALLDDMHEIIASTHPAGERWWSDACERAARARSSLSP